MQGDKAYPLRVLREPQVCSRIGIHRATMWRKIAAGKFPKPIKIGANSNGWIEAEIDAWLHERIAERDVRRETAALDPDTLETR
jgi:prophage regulatory protein